MSSRVYSIISIRCLFFDYLLVKWFSLLIKSILRSNLWQVCAYMLSIISLPIHYQQHISFILDKQVWHNHWPIILVLSVPNRGPLSTKLNFFQLNLINTSQSYDVANHFVLSVVRHSFFILTHKKEQDFETFMISFLISEVLHFGFNSSCLYVV